MNDLIAKIPSELKNQIRRGAQPDWIDPMLATLTDERFSREGWIFERKFDGERCLAFKKGEEIQLYSRNHKTINDSYPEIVEALERCPHDVILDGEVVTFQGEITSFAKLQGRIQMHNPEEARHSGVDIYYYLFDLLFLDGYDISQLPLIQRKYLLQQAIDYKDPLRYVVHRETEGKSFFQAVCREGWEGIIAKRANGEYIHRRSNDWLKFKCIREQEFVIGGFTNPQGTRIGFGALLVGYYQDNKLLYAGKVGTGFNDETLRSLKNKLSQMVQGSSPFSDEIKEGGIHWIKPELVAQIGFTEWTLYNKLRHPRYLGLRRDKSPRDVVKEESLP